MKWASVLGLGMICALSACESTTGSKAPVPYESTAQISPTGVSTFKVRSYVKTGDQRAEFKGAECTMTGQGFRSEFKTPANVSAPVFGPDTKPVKLACKHQDQTKVIMVKTFNETQADANKSLISLKSATSVTGAVIAAAKIGTAMAPRDKAQDVYVYRDRAVVFEGN